MSTRPIAPRIDGEGSIGTAAKHWGAGHFDTLPNWQEYLAESTGYGVVSGFNATISGMVVSVDSGVYHTQDGKRVTTAAKDITVDAADASNPRIDLIYLDSNYVVQYVAGTAAATPTAPSLPDGAVDSLYTVSVVAGASTVSVAKKTTHKPRYHNLGMVSVKEFGAVGDGETDDTLAIQEALNTGDVVYFPAGNYKVTARLNVTKAACITGSDAKIISGTEGLAYKFLVNERKNVLFSNLHFDSNLVGRGSIQFVGCTDCKVDKCSFTGYTAEYGYYKTDSQVLDDNSVRTAITNCLFYDNGNQYGAATATLNRCITSQGGSNCLVANCRFVDFNQGIVYNTSGLQVKNCYFWGNRDNCIYGGGTANIIGNIFEHAYDEVIVVGGNANASFVINGNQFIDPDNKAIAISGNCAAMTINGNIFSCSNDCDVTIFAYRDSSYLISDLMFTNNIVICENEKTEGRQNYFQIGAFYYFQISGNCMFFSSTSQYSIAIYFAGDSVNGVLDIFNNRFKNKYVYSDCRVINALANITTNIKDNTYQNMLNIDHIRTFDISGRPWSQTTNKITNIRAFVTKFPGYSIWSLQFTTTAALAKYDGVIGDISDIFSSVGRTNSFLMYTPGGTYSVQARPTYILCQTAIPADTTVSFSGIVTKD